MDREFSNSVIPDQDRMSEIIYDRFDDIETTPYSGTDELSKPISSILQKSRILNEKHA